MKFKKSLLRNKDFFFNLIGAWRVERTISEYGNASGFARFSLENEGLLKYFEKMEVRPRCSAEKMWIARKKYFFQFNNENNQIIQLFENKQVFNRFTQDESNTKLVSTHYCKDDIYKGYLKFVGDDKIETVYVITGPNKNFSIRSILTKM